MLVLRYHADLDDAAIADLMQITPSAVRATASRALATLRERGRLETTLSPSTHTSLALEAHDG